MEIWKDIKGYEGRYQVSDQGRVKSLERKVKYKAGKLRLMKERILKAGLNTHGYSFVALHNGKGQISKCISRLVALHFIPNPENKRTVNHKNGVKINDWAENLEWMTDSENHKHAYDVLGRNPYWLGRLGKKHHSSKPVMQLTLSGELLAEYGGQREAGRKTGVDQRNISAAILGKYKTAGGFKWKFKEKIAC